MIGHLSLHSPVGDLTVHEVDGALVSLDWGWVPGGTASPLLARAKAQIEAYFDGELERFTLPLAPEGTTFQRKVWTEISNIPYGKTITYGDIARTVNSHARAVGGACARNPLPLLIPCHRVTGTDGALTGYSGDGGRATKAALLRLEGVYAPQDDLFISES